MGKTICFANNKGGVAKTTTCLTIGQIWAKMGKKVLFIDLDSQANLTSLVSSVAPEDHETYIFDIFMDKSKLNVEYAADNIDLIPSGLALSRFDSVTAGQTGRDYLLADIIKPLKNIYDFILIDCPPALGPIITNALIASDYLVMPTTADSLSYEGMAMIATLYSEIRSNDRLNPSLDLLAVIVTKYENNSISAAFLDKYKEAMKESLLLPPIRKATKIQQAAALRRGLLDYDPNGKATQDYIEIAQHLAARIIQ